jgi:5-methylcytosine-specific restriction endonuclease McrA
MRDQREYRKAYYAAHREEAKAYSLKFFYERHDECLAKQREYRNANPEKVSLSKKASYHKNKAHYRALGTAWKNNNREKYNADCRAWRRANPTRVALIAQNRRAVKKACAVISLTYSEWQAIKKSQSGKCAHCLQKTKLQIDHIIPLNDGGAHAAFNVQGLCALCNQRKGKRVAPGTQATLFDRIPA